MIIQVTVIQDDFFENLKRLFTIFKQVYQLNKISYGLEIFSRHYIPFH